MNRLLAATAALTLLGCQDPASGFPDESDPTPEPGENTLPFRVQDRRLAVYDPDPDTYEPLFLTLGENSNDTEGAVLFTIGDRGFCPPTSASKIWNNGVLDFHVFGWGPVVVRRYLVGDQLAWEYVDGGVTRMDRICTLPENQRVPKAREPRFRLF
jgi:hypothetical protein